MNRPLTLAQTTVTIGPTTWIENHFKVDYGVAEVRLMTLPITGNGQAFLEAPPPCTPRLLNATDVSAHKPSPETPSKGSKVGTGIGVVATAVFVAGVIAAVLRRRRKESSTHEYSEGNKSNGNNSPQGVKMGNMHEKDDGIDAVHELEAPLVPIEMPLGNESVEMEAKYLPPEVATTKESPKERQLLDSTYTVGNRTLETNDFSEFSGGIYFTRRNCSFFENGSTASCTQSISYSGDGTVFKTSIEYKTVAAFREVTITGNVDGYLRATETCNLGPSTVHGSSSTSTTVMATNDSRPEGERLSKGSEAGISVATVSAALLVLIVVLAFWRQRRRSSAREQHVQNESHGQADAHPSYEPADEDVKKDISHTLPELEAPNTIFEMPAFRDPVESPGDSVDARPQSPTSIDNRPLSALSDDVRSTVSPLSTIRST
ncbi:hypothetical protein PRZ48_004572 [Zasmidium cellare]|uniref:Uncharacterized protein n=1 Tax=Zasmidium cellare TaxID=395010 RepID=A0ABR0EPW7_ZASCE|nr:hypothetical protein PRZ48_004572 [Zasmidium cellare]